MGRNCRRFRRLSDEFSNKLCGRLLAYLSSFLWPITTFLKQLTDIPRWQATVISFAGVIAAMFGVIIVGTIIMAYYQPAGG